MSTFRKALLKVDTYHAPQGTVTVTPERLKHWEREAKRLQAAGYVIPMHFDHRKDFLEPIAMGVLEKGTDRSAEATVGKLKSFTVTPDGQAAEIIVETLTPSAREKVEANAVFVSPVIHPTWQDNKGNKFQDVITSLDLVDWPVDPSQTSFVPAVAMSLKGEKQKPFLLSLQMDGEENVQATETAADPSTTPAEDTTQSNPPATTPMGDMLAELAKLQIVLPDDTTGDNFIDRLLTALKTRNAVEAEPEEESDETPVDTSALQQENPAVATMSLQLQRMQDRFIAAHKRELTARIEKCVKEGRATPAQAAKIRSRMSVVTMSLGDGESVDSGDVESMIAVLEENAPGSQWTNEQRTQNYQLSLVPAPDSFGAGRVAKSDEDAAVEALTRDLRKGSKKQA